MAPRGRIAFDLGEDFDEVLKKYYDDMDSLCRRMELDNERFTIVGDGVPGILDLPDGVWTTRMSWRYVLDSLDAAHPRIWQRDGPWLHTTGETTYGRWVWVCFGDSADSAFPAFLDIIVSPPWMLSDSD